MEILNLAGPGYDFGDVLFAVLQECEHQRRGLDDEEVRPGLLAAARKKLDEVRESYEEAGGSAAYWERLEHEVLETAMPQYVAGAAEQNRLERTGFGVWRRGDPLSRAAFGAAGLTLGGLIIYAPFIPIVEEPFAFGLAAAGFLYPEVKRLYHEWRHTRLLNRLVVDAEKYQRNDRIHYVSNARMEEELRAMSVLPERHGSRRREPDSDGEPPTHSPPSPAGPAQEPDRQGSNVLKHRSRS